MGLSNRAILDVVEIVYYAPVLLLSLWIVKKHGMGRQAGWLYLAILAVIRIVGSATGIAADSDPSTGLIEASLICYGIGLSPLCLAWLGIIKRVNESMDFHQFPPKFLAFIQIPVIVGLALGIVGGIDLYSSNANSREHGLTYSKAGVILFLLVVILLATVTIFTFLQMRRVMSGEKRLVYACLASIPFLFVRIIYSIIVDFDRSSTVFSFTSTRNAAVVAQAMMSTLMEFIVVALYLAAGFATPAIPRSMVTRGCEDGVAPMQQPQAQYGGLPSRNNSPANYPMTGAQINNKGYSAEQQSGLTSNRQGQHGGELSA